jgi:hypothetical protein
VNRSDTVGVLIIYVLLLIAFATIPLAGGYKAAYISLLLFNLATGFFLLGTAASPYIFGCAKALFSRNSRIGGTHDNETH